MEYLNYIREDLKYLRMIHTTSLIILFVVSYLIITSWNSYSLLSRQLQQFSTDINSLKTNKQFSTTIVKFKPLWADKYSQNINTSLLDYTDNSIRLSNSGTNAARDHFRLLPTNTTNLLVEDILQNLMSNLTLINWKLGVIDSIQKNVDLSVYLNELENKKEHTSYHFSDLAVVSWPSEISIGESKINLNLSYYHKSILRILGKTSREKKFTMKWTEKNDTINVTEEEVFDVYPLLEKNWEQIHLLNLKNALDWSNTLKIKPLENKKPQILGLNIETKYIGIISPIVILICQLLILSYLINLLKNFNHLLSMDCKSSKFIFTSPWIGTMDNVPAFLFTNISLIIFPSLAASISIWRFTLISKNITFAIMMFFLLIGFINTNISKLISYNIHKNNNTQINRQKDNQHPKNE
ncbi:MAG: hypothetical protein P9M11_06705 [Candidatus Tenebribacter burtonii]|nr:hypothetical protein [Candidatus Tenebribacter burtonii]